MKFEVVRRINTCSSEADSLSNLILVPVAISLKEFDSINELIPAAKTTATRLSNVEFNAEKYDFQDLSVVRRVRFEPCISSLQMDLVPLKVSTIFLSIKTASESVSSDESGYFSTPSFDKTWH